jgi:integrase
MDGFYEERIKPRVVLTSQQQFARWMDPIVAKIGSMRANMVDKEILLHVVGLDEMYRTRPATAGAIHGYLRAAYDLARFYHGIEDNPADWEHPLVGDYKSKRRLALPYEELGQFMAALRAFEENNRRYIGHPNVALCLEWLILAACRRSEACRVQWKDVAGWQTEKNATWHVPAIKHKAGHRGDEETGDPWDCPITEPMKAILKEMESRYPNATDEDFVFRSPHRSRRTPVDPTALNGQLGRLKWPTKCHVHGFRTTFAMWAEYAGYPQELIKRQHIHKTEGTAGMYRHHGRGLQDATLERRRPMMEEYANYVGRPEPYKDNVVEFKAAQS